MQDANDVVDTYLEDRELVAVPAVVWQNTTELVKIQQELMDLLSKKVVELEGIAAEKLRRDSESAAAAMQRAITAMRTR